MVWLYIFIPIILLAIFAMVAYNKFIKLQNLVTEAWSLIDVQLKLRYDMIPNLVQTLKAYMNHEKQILTDVAALRAKAMETSTPQG
ncbi:MAG: LemA family protein, partial [Bacteroidetes bacterium]|nr:LemA family protein [Bacteroidota bacterium]